MRQRCIAGEVEDCERACRKSVAGEGGCFHAGELHRVRAELDVKSPEFQKATSFFEKACEGKHPDGCLFWAQMIETPYGVPDDSGGDSMPPLITDREVVERERRLSLACDLDSTQGCKRLGDVLAGKNSERALAAYTKSCAKSARTADCVSSMNAFVTGLEALRSACTRGDAASCTLLGNALFAVDPPRALRLFASECELRGVASIAGSSGRFVRARVEEARRGGSAAPKRESPPEHVESDFTVRVESVQGDLAFVEAERTLKPQAAWLSDCSKLVHGKAGQTQLRLTVDLSGDVYRAAVVGGTLPPQASQCVARAFEDADFKRTLKELTTVELTAAYSAQVAR